MIWVVCPLCRRRVADGKQCILSIRVNLGQGRFRCQFRRDGLYLALERLDKLLPIIHLFSGELETLGILGGNFHRLLQILQIPINVFDRLLNLFRVPSKL